MKDIKYSFELLKDFNNLLREFSCFMTMNLMHQDKCEGLTSDCQIAIKGLITFSINENKKANFGIFFKPPIQKFEAENKEKLLKNFVQLMNFLYSYLEYARPILKTCKPEVYKNGRFDGQKEDGSTNKNGIQLLFINFCAKYNITPDKDLKYIFKH